MTKYPVCASKTVYERIFGNFGIGFRSLHHSKSNFYVWFWIFCWRQFGGLGQVSQLMIDLTKTVKAHEAWVMIITDQTIWSFRAHLVWSLMFKLLIYFANYDFCQVILVNDFLPLASEKNVGVLVHVHVHLYVCGTTKIMFSFPRIYTYKLFSPSVTPTNS